MMSAAMNGLFANLGLRIKPTAPLRSRTFYDVRPTLECLSKLARI